MAGLSSTRVEPNEVVKADDFSYGFDSQIDNISKMLQSFLDPERDFVINGEVTPYDGGGLSISVNPILGVCKDTGISFIETEKTGPIGIGGTWAVDRIDIVEVCGELTNTTLEQRAFIDFNTKQKTLQNVYTKKEVQLKIRVKHNPDDGQVYATAPDTSDGWVKLCEIFVPANAIDINECTINNITSDIAGEDNEEWTNETDRTYNIGYISARNESFREEHNQDGTHKASVIHQSNLDTGTGQNQINGNAIPLGGANVQLNGDTYGSSTAIREMISTIASKVTDLFNDYLKNGAFNFNGELCLSEILDEDTNLLSNSLKLGADGEGTAYCKIGDNVIFTITESGTIRVAEGYSATNTYDLVTKGVTDALIKTINGISATNGAANITGDDINLSASNETKLSTRSEVNLNGESKAGDTAEFYAPVEVGTKGQVLMSSGEGAPSWSELPSSKMPNYNNLIASKMVRNNGTGTQSTVISWTATADCVVHCSTMYGQYSGGGSSYTCFGYIKVNNKSVIPSQDDIYKGIDVANGHHEIRTLFLKKGDVLSMQGYSGISYYYAFGLA